MEFVNGKTLRQLISEGLDWQTSAKLGRDVAQGLAAAHDRNMMHRDIKPENVIVTCDGRAKVLDFGLARPTTSANEQAITLHNMVPGTVPYMSPEQAESSDLTCATDVFSLGTVLYEMLSGKNPFRVGGVIETMQAVAAASPMPIREQSDDIPDKFADLVMRMLSRQPSRRPMANEVAALLNDLLLSQTGKRVPNSFTVVENSLQKQPELANLAEGQPTIAVLPFQVVTTDESCRPFGEAIAQEIIVELSKLHWMFVIARGSSFQFRDPNANLSDISRLLGARYILTGSIEVHGKKCVVAVELSRAPNSHVVWAERYNGTVEDLLQLRQSITTQIVMTIESRVQMTEATQAVRISTANLDAWSAYHRGLWHMYRFNRRDNDIANEMFRRAIAEDAQFARAYAGLSFTHFQNAFLRLSDNSDEQRKLAKQHAEKSLELDPMDPFAHLTMGRSSWLDGDIEQAAAWLDQSLNLRPNFAFTLYNHALIDNLMNDGEGSEQKINKAMALSPIDPLNYAMFATRGISHIVRGEYDRAIEWTDLAIRQPTAHVHIFMIAALANELAGRHDVALKHAATVRKKDPHYNQSNFIRMFTFRDDNTAATLQAALDQLSFGSDE